MFHSNGNIAFIFYAILEESVNLITSRNVLFFPSCRRRTKRKDSEYVKNRETVKWAAKTDLVA